MAQINVVYFYSSKDRDNIKAGHLTALGKSNSEIKVASSELVVGDEMEAALDNLLEKADVLILFLSISFYISDFYTSREREILEKLNRRDCEVISVYLESHDLEGYPKEFQKMRFFPSKNESILAFQGNDPEVKWKELSEEIKRAAEKVKGERAAIETAKVRRAKPNLKKLVDLCNRDRQYRQMKALLDRRNESLLAAVPPPEKASPIMLFIHGSPEENLDNYRKRLKETELKKLLKADVGKYSPEIIWLTDFYELSDIAEYLCRDLATVLDLDPDASKKEIETRLGEHSYPVMISYRMETAHWTKVFPPGSSDESKAIEPTQVIREFLEFWNDIQVKQPDVQIIVCLFFKYQRTGQMPDDSPEEASAKRFFRRESPTAEDRAEYGKFRLPAHWFPNGDKLPDRNATAAPPENPATNMAMEFTAAYKGDKKLSPFRTFFKFLSGGKTGEPDIAATAAEDRSQMENHQPSFENLFGVVLDELPPVGLGQVNRWLNETETKTKLQEICPQYDEAFCDGESLLDAVEKHYGTLGDKRLPMSKLTEILEEYLEAHRCN